MRLMKNLVSIVYVSLLAILLLSLPSAAQAGKTRFISFDFPLAGVTDTEATGITPSGVIVGRYFSSDHVEHGFVLENGEFTSIDVPGSTFTDLTWINAGGTIVGGYGSVDGTFRGYELKKGIFTIIDYPGSPETFDLFGISDSGIIVGPECACGWYTAEGFLFSHGKFSLINYPGAMGTYPTMLINPDFVVGAYIDDIYRYHGFLLKDGNFTTVDYPGSTFTWFTGVNPKGTTVGFYMDATGQHGLEYDLKTDKFVSVDVPVQGASSTEVNGINSQGDIVGRYIGPDGKTHGYLLHAADRE